MKIARSWKQISTIDLHIRVWLIIRSRAVDANPDWPTPTARWKLACVARVHYLTKSQDLILRVMRAPKWRARPCRSRFGDSITVGLDHFRRALDLYGLHQHVSYGGVSSNIEELWSRYHGLLLPSRVEGNSLSLIEAMMCGRVPNRNESWPGRGID